MTEFTHYLPRIFGFWSLFTEAGTDSDIFWPGDTEETRKTTGGFHNKYGFPAGASILLTGAPGTGKTVFSLAFIRNLMSFDAPRAYGSIDHAPHFVGEESHLLYISAENSYEKLQRSFTNFGWFNDPDGVFAPERVHVPDISINQLTRPLKTPDDFIDFVGIKITPYIDVIGRNKRVFVIVDSLTAFLKDCHTAGESRWYASEIIRRVNHAFPKSQLGLLCLLSEITSTKDHEIQSEEYVSDFVLRFRTKTGAEGHRLRVFEAVKSRGATMKLGEHSWALIGKNHYDPIQSIEVQDRVYSGVCGINRSPNESLKYATIAVFPRIGVSGKTSRVEFEEKKQWTGIPGLDEMMDFIPEYWLGREHHFRPDKLDNIWSLTRGQSLLLLGTSGCGKSTMCVQYLMGENNPKRTLYVSFENELKAIESVFPGSNDEFFNNCRFFYRSRSNLDMNLLVAEVGHAIRIGRMSRVVLDGLSTLLATVEPREYSRFVEILLNTIRSINPPPSVFITFETVASISNIANADKLTQGLSGIADHVIVLRQLQIADEIRKTIYVLKSRGLSHDRLVREVCIRDRKNLPQTTYGLPLKICSTLESYTGLLSGEPNPVKIAFQLFSENQAEESFNRQIVQDIRKLFGHRVNVLGFSTNELTRTLNDAVLLTGRIHHTDVKVLAIDEWWIREFEVLNEKIPSPLLRLDPFLLPKMAHSCDADGQATSLPQPIRMSEFLPIEWEKVAVVRDTRHDTKKATRQEKAQSLFPSEENSDFIDITLLAVPNYRNFALFCVDQAIMTKIDAKRAGLNKEMKFSFLDAIPRSWINREENGDFAPPQDISDTPQKPIVLVDLMKAAVESDSSVIGFAFEMQTLETFFCTFLEMCWSFGANETFLVEDVITYENNSFSDQDIADHSMTEAICFFQYLVRHRLMKTGPKTSCSSDRALFSRRWYSTLPEKKDVSDENATNDFIALPFLPIAPLKNDSDKEKLIESQIKKLAGRITRFGERLLTRAILGNSENSLEETFQSVFAATDSDITTLQNKLGLIKTLCDEIFEGQLDEMNFKDAIERLTGTKNRLVCPPNRSAKKLYKYIASSLAMTKESCVYYINRYRFWLKQIEMEMQGKGLSSACAEWQQEVKDSQIVSSEKITSLSGFSCSGSWLFGIHRDSHSPNFSWTLIEEMLTPKHDTLRGETGAGIPARNDFFQFHANEKVPRNPEFDWNDFDLFFGSHASRRDAAFCRRISLLEIAQFIYDNLKNLLSEASHKDWETVKADSAKLTKRIFGKIIIMKSQASRKDEGPCLNCLAAPESCFCIRINSVE